MKVDVPRSRVGETAGELLQSFGPDVVKTLTRRIPGELPSPPRTARAVKRSQVRSVGTARLGIERSLRSHPPVLALTLLREHRRQEEVLVGVRTAHNGTHQNVMSVPTIRVLPEVAKGWAAPLADGFVTRSGLRRRPGLERTVRHVVREILALKLGKAGGLERGDVKFEIEAMMAIQGTSLLASSGDEDVTEDLTMFNAQVRWTDGSHFREGWTVSYKPLLWITEAKFSEMARTRDVGVLDEGLDEIEVCVRGLCIDSTVRTLDRRR
jgi:hypothetical protein